MFSIRFGSVIRLIWGDKRGIKSSGTMYSAEMSIIYGTPQKNGCTWPDQVETAFPNVKALKEINKYRGIKGYQTGICCIHWFILMQRPHQHICSQGKLERHLVPLLLNQIGLGTQLRRTLKGKVINRLMFHVIFWDFLCRQGNH